MLAPLLLGGAPVWVPAALLPLALGALGLAVWGRREMRVPLVALVPLCVAAICLAQLVPLPPGLLELASPTAAALREFALVPLGLSSWRPISLDPPSTWHEALKWTLYAATTLAALHLTQRARSKLLPLQCIAIAGAALIAIAGLHVLFGVEELFGLYRFREANPQLMTPFGNPNHLAGFLILAGTLSVGFLLESRLATRAALWAVCWVTCCAGVLLSNSRAGIAVFIAAQGTFVALTLWRVGSSSRRAVSAGIRVSLAAVIAVVAGVELFGERLLTRFADLGGGAAGKFAQWPRALELVRDCWRSGVGRGAYEVAFTRYYDGALANTFTHPENLVLQWTAELGVPLAMAFAVGGGLAILRLWRGGSGAYWELAVLLGAVAVAIHNLFDFNLEFPGVAVPVAAALGVVGGASEGQVFRRVPSLAVAAGLILVGALGAWKGRDTVNTADARLVALMKSHAPIEQLQTAAIAEIDAHPADFLLYSRVAAGWSAAGRPREALAFANRSLWLFPRDGGTHFIAARALRQLGKRSQSLLEYRLALQMAPETPRLAEATTFAKDLEELWMLSGRSVGSVRQVAQQAAAVRPELATQLLLFAAAELEQERDVQLLVLDAVRALSARKRTLEARQVLLEAQGKLPPSPDLTLALASLELGAGNGAAAEAALDEGLKRWPGHFELTRQRVTSLSALKKWTEARALLARANSSATDSGQRLELTLSEAAIDIEQGLTARGLEGFRTAVRLAPSSRTHQGLAGALARTKRYDDSVGELRAAQRFEGPEGAKALEQTILAIEAARDADRKPAPGP